MDAAIAAILGSNVVHSEENERTKRGGDRHHGSPGGTKRVWNKQRKPKNRETARQLRNRSGWTKRQGSNISIHSACICSEGISNIQLAF